LRKAIEKQDLPSFNAADHLTEACNGCHVATNFEFNRVQRPAATILRIKPEPVRP
jgi:hypothetical protein